MIKYDRIVRSCMRLELVVLRKGNLSINHLILIGEYEWLNLR